MGVEGPGKQYTNRNAYITRGAHGWGRGMMITTLPYLSAPTIVHFAPKNKKG